MIVEASQEGILDVLNHYAQQLESLIKLLHEEHASLRARDIASLEKCTTQKHKLLLQLETLESKRKQINKQLLEQSKGGSNDNPTSRELIDLNNRVQLLLDDCRHQNEINGAVIEISRQFSQQLLGIMFGAPPSESIYNSAGQNATQFPGQSVARI